MPTILSYIKLVSKIQKPDMKRSNADIIGKICGENWVAFLGDPIFPKALLPCSIEEGNGSISWSNVTSYETYPRVNITVIITPRKNMYHTTTQICVE